MNSIAFSTFTKFTVFYTCFYEILLCTFYKIYFLFEKVLYKRSLIYLFLFKGNPFLQTYYKIKACKIHYLFLPYQENKTSKYQRNSFPSTLFFSFIYFFFVKAFFICIYLFKKRTHSSSCLD